MWIQSLPHYPPCPSNSCTASARPPLHGRAETNHEARRLQLIGMNQTCMPLFHCLLSLRRCVCTPPGLAWLPQMAVARLAAVLHRCRPPSLSTISHRAPGGTWVPTKSPSGAVTPYCLPLPNARQRFVKPAHCSVLWWCFIGVCTTRVIQWRRSLLLGAPSMWVVFR